MCKYECKCMWNMSTSEENPKQMREEWKKKDKYYQWLQVDVLCGHATGKACF